MTESTPGPTPGNATGIVKTLFADTTGRSDLSSKTKIYVDPKRSEKALDHFKDWSNYLLVTTVAAMGWVATKDSGIGDHCSRAICLVLFGLSAFFAMLTLALIPLVAEQQKDGDSFYDVKADYHLFWIPGKHRIKWACLPQHFFFIVGTFWFVWAAAQSQKVPKPPLEVHLNPATLNVQSITATPKADTTKPASGAPPADMAPKEPPKNP